MDLTLLQLALADGGAAPSPFLQLLPLLLVFGIFYFLLLAPMRKRQKAHAKLLGEVAAVEEKVIHLKLADNVKVRVVKSAVAGLESDPAAIEGAPK